MGETPLQLQNVVAGIIVIAAIFTVWICFSFLVFPRCKDPVRLVVRNSGSELIFQQNAETWNFRNGNTKISVEAFSITAHSSFPLIGGERRGLITRVLQNNEQLFALAGSQFRFSGGPGFFREFFLLDLPIDVLLPGVSFFVLFDGKELYFDRSIRL